MKQNKSAKLKSKKSKSGTKYILFDDMPDDQKAAWRKMGGLHTCPRIEEEGDKYTPYYHEYEIFYEAWAEGGRMLWD